MATDEVGAAAGVGECEREPDPSDSLRTFGPVVQAVREHPGINRTDFSEQVRFSKRTVSSWKRGRRMPDLSFVERAEELLANTGALRNAAKHLGLWRKNWEHFAAFWKFPPGVRKIVYTTNMIESLNSRLRQASRRRGHFLSEDAALKVLYLAIRHHEPNRPNPTGRTHNWKAAINVRADSRATVSSHSSCSKRLGKGK